MAGKGSYSDRNRSPSVQSDTGSVKHPVIEAVKAAYQERKEQREQEKQDRAAMVAAAKEKENGLRQEAQKKYEAWLQAPPGPEKDNLWKDYNASYDALSQAVRETRDAGKSEAQKKVENTAKQVASGAAGVAGAAAGVMGMTRFGPTAKFMQDTQDPMSAHDRRQADMHEQQAADEQMNSQKEMQIGNLNYRGEAEKNAMSEAASENAQKVANMGNASAGAAALERGVAKADYNTHMARSDEARREGVKNQREMYGAKQVAEHERSVGDDRDAMRRDMTQRNMMSGVLSNPPQAGGGNDGANKGQEPQDEPGGEQEPQEEETKPEETQPEEPQEQEPQPEETQPEEPQQPEEQKPAAASGDPQKVINELTGAEDPKNRPQTEGDKQLLQEVMQKFGVKRITRNDQSRANPNLAESQFLKESGGDAKGAIEFLRTQRAGGDSSKAAQNYNRNNDQYTAEGSGEQMNHETAVPIDQGTGTGSDARIKNIVRTISSFRF